ncbi:MAG: heme-binding domain-containing protein [Opitutaceae bacterium]|nr:heme-binding domain-containing protein [Cephaloticoccus sp.]MCP5529205.1 heme-binding domain-containing protein [Opitutaceae bacterium]
MRVILGIFIAAAVIIQFFRPEKNLSAAAPDRNDLLLMHPTAPEVGDALKRACYDCHSDHTRYPWYAEIQPVAWWLDSHVREGKEHLNFSQFGRYSTKRQLHKLDELIGEVEDGKMPLASYKFVHAEARLTDAEVDMLVAWAEDLQDQISAP